MKKRSLLVIALSLIVVLCLVLSVACETDPVQNTISFEIGVEGYTGDGIADQTIATGSDLTLPAAPAIEYYEFEYWQLGDAQYQAGDTYTVETDGDITFTAVYAETFVLTFVVAEGLTAPEAMSGKVGAQVTLAEGADDGYNEFKSWVIGEVEYEAGATYSPVHGANVATALYTGTFVLNFAVDEGLVAPNAAAGKVGEEVTLPAAPEKADCEFEGWLINGTLYAAGAKFSPELGVTTATAQYKVAFVYATFAIEDGSGIEGNLGDPVRVAVGGSIEESDVPELTATKEFNSVAWYIGDEQVDLSELTINENVTITAKNVYVGSDENAFIFIEVKDEDANVIGYSVMADTNWSDYAESGRIGIPASHEGLPVVAIAAGSTSENAFGNTAAAGLTYIYLPASITEIGAYAFYQNATLVNVVYEEGIQLETIGNYSFYYASALETISNLEIISDSDDSEGNNGIYFPASVKTIGNGAFRGVSQNTREINVYFDAANGVLESIGNDAFRSDGTTTAKLSGFVLNTAFPSTLKSIGEYAFHCNPIIGRVDFGDNATIETIGAYAFGQHTLTSTLITYTLTELVIPKSVTSIGMHAFQNNQALAYVEFEEGSPITVFSEYIFSMSYALEEMIFPAGLTTIEAYAFNNSFSTANDGAGIALNGADGKFVIPAGVTVFPANAFNGSVFSSVTIPATVTEIGTNAFAAAKIPNLSFAEGGTEGLVIGATAFSSQYIQTALTIPARVTSIGADAFWKANLTSLSFEDGELPLAIENNAFNAAGTSTSASLSSSTTFYPFSATSVTLPARTKSIGTAAFYGQFFLQEVKFAEGCKITAIPNYAFAYCSNLRSVDIPESVTTIGQYAYTVYSLAGIKSTVYNDGTASTTTHTVADMYIDIKTLTIPANVESIDTYAFYNRGLKLESLVFEGTAENNDLTIGNYSFSILSTYASALDATNNGNVTLKSVKFPANLVSVGGLFLNGAITSVTCQYFALATADLSDCARLTTLGDNFMAGMALTSISIPDSVTTIGNYVFANKIVANGDITKTMKVADNTTVTLPAGLVSLGSYFCAAVDGVVGYSISDSNENYKTVDGVIYSKDGTTLVNYPFGKTATSYKIIDGCTTIADGALKSNATLTSIDFNDVKTVAGTYGLAKTAITSLNHEFESLGNYTFLGSALETVVINITGSTAPTYLFQNCTSLTTVTLGENITELGNFAFSGCTSLTTVNASSNLVKLGNSIFASCSALVSIDLSSVTTIGTNVFQNASKLETVKLGGIATIGVNVFNGTALKSLILTGDTMATLGNVSAFTGVSGAKVYVKANLIADYEAAANWSTLVGNGSVSFVAIAED